MSVRPVSASVLTRLLASRHADGVFVPQCKMGSARSRVLDGWALLPTWSPLTTIGYEIKVSRSDWLQDQKFEEYRTACHLFFVVAPKALVAAAELPVGVGLLEPIGQGDGMRLVMRVKAVRQQPDPVQLVNLMSHVLMWNRMMGVSPSAGVERSRRAAFWSTWVNERQSFSRLGNSVKGRMRDILADAIRRAEAAEAQAKSLEEASRVLRELGVRPGAWNIRRAITDAVTAAGDETWLSIRRARHALEAVESHIEQLRPEAARETRHD